MRKKSWREEVADRLDDMAALRPTPGLTIYKGDNPFWRSPLTTKYEPVFPNALLLAETDNG